MQGKRRLEGENGEEAHYRTGLVCRVSNTLGKGSFALGKGFAECGTRQTALGKKSDGEGTFAECLFSGTRQSLCRVSKSTRQTFRNQIRKTVFKNSKTFYFHPVITPIIQYHKSQVSLLFRVKSHYAAALIRTRDLLLRV